MKKFFTLIAAVMMAVSANATLETVASYTIVTEATTGGDPIEAVGCTVQLHATAIANYPSNSEKQGIKLDSENKYIQVDLKEELQAGDIVFVSYYLGSSAQEDETEGLSLANAKTGAEGYAEYTKMYAHVADKKYMTTEGYYAVGGEKRFIITRLSSSTFFHQIKVVRGYASSVDFTNPAINTVETAEANLALQENLTIKDTEDSTSGAAVAEWNNTKGGTPTVFDFSAAPVGVVYCNSSAKTIAKSRTTGFQFNSTGAMMRITCAKDATITITPASYSKVGGATVYGADQTEISFPKETTTPATLTAKGNNVTFKVNTAFLMAKIEITNPATGIESVKAAKAAQNDAIYNIAGQKVGADYKGLVIKNGQKMMQK